jgi:hypothetical protein
VFRTSIHGPRGAPRNGAAHDDTQAKLKRYVDRFPQMPAHRRAALWTYLVLAQLSADSRETVNRQKRRSDGA